MELPLTKLMGEAGSEGKDEEFRCYALSLRCTRKGGWVVGYNRRLEFGVGICIGDCAQFYLYSFASFCFT